MRKLHLVEWVSLDAMVFPLIPSLGMGSEETISSNSFQALAKIPIFKLGWRGIGIQDLFKENALLGFAAGQPFLVSSNLEAYSPQTNLELFYRLSVGDNMTLTPAVQYVLNPFNVEPAAGQPDNSILQFLIRSTFSF